MFIKNEKGRRYQESMVPLNMAMSVTIVQSGNTNDDEEKLLNHELNAQAKRVFDKIRDPNYQLSVLITGPSQAGKSSLIIEFFGQEINDGLDDMTSAIGNNGRPTTQDVCVNACYRYE